ncbi:MAG TPA: hypothetical protein VGS03_08125 [Candidatus Polarisedimenticolia bacterium]|jgi:hypothetical protein|nr:hypothetical protein [Candidatus Polarisedimenticolia bacterium]
MSFHSLLGRSIRLFRREKLGSALLPPIDDALAELDSSLRRQLNGGWPKEWTGPDLPSENADTDRTLLISLYRAAFHCERGDIDSYRAGLEQVVNSSGHGAMQVSAIRLLISLLWVQVIEAPRDEQGEGSEQPDRSRGLLSTLCERVDRDYADSPWSDIVLFFSESARGIVSFYAGEKAAAKLHLRRAEGLQPRVEKTGDFGIEDLVGFASLARGQMAVEDGTCDVARRWLLSATHRLEGDTQAEAYAWLAHSELDLGLLGEARESAERGMRIKRASGFARDGRDDSLEGALAEALVRLGESKRARQVLMTIVQEGVSESKRRWAEEALQRIGN